MGVKKSKAAELHTMRISELIIFLISLKSKNEMKSRMVVIFYRNQSNLIYFKIKKSQIFQKLIFQKKENVKKRRLAKFFKSGKM